MKIVTCGPNLITLPEEPSPKPWRRYNEKLKLEVFTHYCNGETPHCQCPGCTVTFIGFLQLDHVNGDGAKHRKDNKLFTGAAMLWRWVRKQGYPADFQVLCRNCNGAKFNYPACPLSGQPHY
jgi:hypothetical protein